MAFTAPRKLRCKVSVTFYQWKPGLSISLSSMLRLELSSLTSQLMEEPIFDSVMIVSILDFYPTLWNGYTLAKPSQWQRRYLQTNLWRRSSSLNRPHTCHWEGCLGFSRYSSGFQSLGFWACYGEHIRGKFLVDLCKFRAKLALSDHS